MNTVVPALITIPGLGPWPGFVSNTGSPLLDRATLEQLIPLVADKFDAVEFHTTAYGGSYLSVDSHDETSHGSVGIFPITVRYGARTFTTYRVNALVPDGYQIEDAAAVASQIIDIYRDDRQACLNFYYRMERHWDSSPILTEILDKLHKYLQVPAVREIGTF
jgi:hypothetical protein